MSATTIQLSAQIPAGQKMSLLTNWIAFDPLQGAGRRTPRPWAVLCISVLAGLSLIGLYRYGARLHLH
ncbi:MAG: hypothetical protein ABW034_09085, partial [Steroidobacteraceae bacterium]